MNQSYANILKKNMKPKKENNVQTVEIVLNNAVATRFNLSDECKRKISIKKGFVVNDSYINQNRTDSDIIQVIRELGEKKCSCMYRNFKNDIKIVSFQYDQKTEIYRLHNFDGYEFIIIYGQNGKTYDIDSDTGNRISCEK